MEESENCRRHNQTSTMMMLASLPLLTVGCVFVTTASAWIHPALHIRRVAARRCSSRGLSMSTDGGANSNLLSVDECLALSQENDNVVFVDGTWFHRGNRNGRREFEEGPRIRGARHVDMGDIATTKEVYPILNPLGLTAMLPNADLFALTMDEFGITNDRHVIVYAKEGALFTPRTYFLFKHFGHGHVSLMQGTLEEWMQKGGPVDTEPTTLPTALSILAAAKSRRPTYQCKTRNDVVDKYKMLDVVNDSNTIIIDPRGSSFVYGHMPGAINVPYSSLVEPDNALKLKSREELLEIFKDKGVDIFNTNQEIIASCGSGVSACHVLLALEECGRTDNVYMYDGSWQEWKQDPSTPKVIPEQQEKQT